MIRHFHAGLSPLALCLSIAAAPAVRAQSLPATGQEVLERMHTAYATKWYHTLTFVQTTKIDRPGQPPADQTWYESLSAPGNLRIDISDPDSGNGVLYLGDSTYVFRAGKLVRQVEGGNPFLPLILGVYVQEPEATIRNLAPYHFDLSKVSSVKTDKGTAWVVGTATAGDTLSPQFWIEPDRLVALRIISGIGTTGLTLDARLDDYVPAGKGWLATRVAIAISNGTNQEEIYKDWKADPPISLDLFDPAKYASAPHWAHPRGP